MTLFHFLSVFVQAAVLILLWRQGRERGRLAQALLAIIAWDLLRGILVHTLTLPEPSTEMMLHGLTQIAAWLLLLGWGLRQEWRWLAVGAVAAAILTLLLPEPMANLLSWGLLTAVPLITFMHTHQRTSNIRFFPPLRRFKKNHRPTIGSMSKDAIASQRPILECITDGVIVFSNEGIIEYANQAAATTLDMSLEALVNQPGTDLLTRLPVPNSQRSANEAQFELNGRMVQGQMSIVYDDNGSVQGTVAILRDISAEYQSERAKNAFLSTVSHELRTPLTAIKGYVELLNSGTSGTLTPTQQMFLTTIQRNVTRMVQLINSLIFASSVKGGRLELTSGYADLRQLINQLIREKKELVEQEKQKFVIDIDSRLQPIQADPMHIATILQELIDNSIKYNQPGGKVTISALLETNSDQEFDFVMVSIADEGIGIDPTDQSHIFEEFFRPDHKEVQVRAGGVGMGLSIVRALVEAYSGRIWFDSQPGQGSIFTFILPTRQPEHMVHLWNQE